MTIVTAFADPAEEAACLALLPELGTAEPELIVARRDGRLVGAAGIVWQSWAKPGGFPLWVHVLPDERRRGVGRALVAAADTAARGEIDGLWSARPLAQDGGAAAFAAACGLAPVRSFAHFAVETASFLAHIEAIVARLRRHGHIPDDIVAIPLRQAPFAPVARLVADEFAQGPVRMLQRLRAAATRDDPALVDLDRSTVILAGDAVLGALLAQRRGDDWAILANVVAAGARKGFVNPLQLAISTRAGWEAGSQTFLFHCDEAVRDSMNLARRSGARQVAAESLYYAALAIA